MNMPEFKALDQVLQEELIRDKGVFLANYVEDDHKCDVYQLYEYFVAFCYDLNHNLQPVITIHEDPTQLPYLWKLRLHPGKQ